MSEPVTCPLCGRTLHNCFHTIEEIVKFLKSQLGLCLDENNAYRAENDLLAKKLEMAIIAMNDAIIKYEKRTNEIHKINNLASIMCGRLEVALAAIAALDGKESEKP
jgi:regulator of replication initiation timing